MNRYPAVFLLLAVCYISSCSLLRSVRGGKGGSSDTVAVAATADTHAIVAPVIPSADTVKKAQNETAARLIDSLQPIINGRIAYKTFSGKARVRYEGPDEKQEVTAHIRMCRDSVIWVNITALGGVVQAARILITPDSFFMINYQDQEVTILPLRDVAKILPARVDFSALQNFIIGDPLRQAEIKAASDSGATWSVIMEDTAYIQQYAYRKTDTTLVSALLSTHHAGGPVAHTHYANYLTIDNRKLSSLRNIDIKKGSDTAFYIDMNFTKMDLDVQQDYPFSIPPNYLRK